MTAALYLPGDWDAMQAAVQAWASAALAPAVPVIWAKQRISPTGAISTIGAPTPARPYALLDLLTPPTQTGQAERRTAGIAVVFDAPSADAEIYTLVINGVAIPHASPSGAGPFTAEDVRDGYQALLEGLGMDALVEIRPTPGYPAALTLTPAQTDPPVVFAAGTDNVSLKTPLAYFGDELCTFTIEVVTTYPQSAVGAVSTLRLALESESALELLRAGGWAAIDVLSVQERDLTWAGLWEDRSSLDFRLGCRSRRIELQDYIETSEIVGALTA